MTELAGKIERVLKAACVGDALGAATEGMHHGDIPAVFGGPVTRLQPPPPRAPFALGLAPGRLTDDATQMLAMAEIAIRTAGAPGLADAVDGLLLWAEDEEMVRRFAGPTTRVALDRLRAGTPPLEVADPGVYSCVYGTSNGGAMRAPVAGCMRPGNPAAAARLATVLAAPTHNSQIAFAGAAAIAGAIAHGLADGDLAGMVEVALDAARQGAELAETTGRITGGPDVARRIAMAAEIGAGFLGAPQRAMVELEAVIGNGVAMAEAVPVAIGLVIAAEGSAWQAIVAAVNGGNDSDTIAMLAGAVAAAFGTDDIDAATAAEVMAVNGLDLAALAQRMRGVLNG